MQNTATKPAEDTEALSVEAARLCQAGKLREAIQPMLRIAELTPENPDILVNLGVAFCQSGNLEDGVDYLGRAYDVAGDDDTVRQNYFLGLLNLQQKLLAEGRYTERLSACRKMRRVMPDHAGVQGDLFGALSDAGAAAEITDFAPHLADETLGTKILIACMPKSGSSWLYSALKEVTKFPGERFAIAFLQNEQELFLPRLIDNATENGVIQQHCRATDPNVSLLQAFGIQPIVLVRNLLDALLSMHDFYCAGAVINTFHVRDWGNLDAETRLDLVVEKVAPWYIDFYASWVLAEQDGKLPVMWLSYEDMMADKSGTLAKVGAYYDLALPQDVIDRAVAGNDTDRTATRFNRGVAGRGAETFSDVQQDRVRRLTRFYPSIDFSPIGL